MVLLLPFLCIYFIVQKCKKRKKGKEIAKLISIFNISQVDLLSGVEFENLLFELFKGLGFSVTLTKATGDYGADLLAKREGKLFVIQAKCYSKTVGAHAVQEILGAKKHYNADGAMVVSNNYFSKEAKIIALENDIKLLDRSDLTNLLEKVNVKIEYKSGKISAFSDTARAEIESKYKCWI